mgnify:CR=1 FL=1
MILSLILLTDNMWFYQDHNEPKKGNTSTENLSPKDNIPVDGRGGSSIQ